MFFLFFFLKPDRFFDGIIVRCYCTGLDHIKDQSLHASGNTSIFRRDSINIWTHIILHRLLWFITYVTLHQLIFLKIISFYEKSKIYMYTGITQYRLKFLLMKKLNLFLYRKEQWMDRAIYKKDLSLWWRYDWLNMFWQ